MRLFFLWTFLFATVAGFAQAQFERDFSNATLRVDYTFSGDAHSQDIALDELRKSEGWAGRRVNLDTLILKGNGQISMSSVKDGRIIYKTSFSTLFQEWQTTEEAKSTRRSFQNVFQLPMPREDADITVTLFDTYHKATGSFTHRVRVQDILIRPISTRQPAPHRYLHKGGSPEKAIDIAIVAEGYTAAEQALFYKDAQIAADELLRYSPFSNYRERINIVGVALPSQESGVSIPGKNIWKHTAVSSHFDTFYSDRYLTTLQLKQLNDALAGIDYEHIIILANTENYGGGGIYNSYTLAAAHHPAFKPVVVHEFGHSFAGLADEYFYPEQEMDFYHSGVEPWEQNITTLAHFSEKWEDMLPANTPVPTPSEGLAPTDTQQIGVYEGAGYKGKGVYRPFQDCRMRTNETPNFCKVCHRAIDRLIRYYTEALPQSRK